MISRVALVLILAPGLIFGQIVINSHATGTPIPSPLVLPDAPVDDGALLQIDIVNTGTTTATVNRVTVFGQYFSICCEAAFTLAPAQVQTLTLTFNPQGTGNMTGSLQVDSQVVFLFARALPAASLFVEAAAGTVQAHEGTPLVFAADPPFSAQIPCALRDDWSGPVTIHSISVTGNWKLSGGPGTPVVLQSGRQAAFTLIATGTSADGSVSGVVHVDQWSYAVIAHPSQPGLQIQISATVLKSGQQSSIAIQFDKAPTAAVKGTLQLTFDAPTTIALADPAIIFPSTGTAVTEFTSVAGQTAASFGGGTSVIFQTGTTAGTIHVTASWGDASVTTDVYITPEPVAIESVIAKRESNALDVTVTGFDNTRTAGRLSFSFFDSGGAFIGNPVTADFTTTFYNYFFHQAYNAGGMFQMTARFPVTGDPTKVAAVQVDMLNSSGDAQSSVTRF